jgi:hypothetical protein
MTEEMVMQKANESQSLEDLDAQGAAKATKPK